MIQITAAHYREGRLIPEQLLNLPEGHKVYLVVTANPEELRSVDSVTAEWEWEPLEVRMQRWRELDEVDLPGMPDDEYEKWMRERDEEKQVVKDALRQLWLSRQTQGEGENTNSHPHHLSTSPPPDPPAKQCW
jgi:predicted DNA-binding antitoxin AbrB/MazE fold protein